MLYHDLLENARSCFKKATSCFKNARSCFFKNGMICIQGQEEGVELDRRGVYRMGGDEVVKNGEISASPVPVGPTVRA